MAHDQEAKEQAKDLYVLEGLTLEQVATETEIPIATVESWSASEGWAGRKREYKASLADIKRKRVLLRKALIDKALQTLDPQDVYAASRMEATSKDHGQASLSVPPEVDRPKLFLEDMEFIVTTLKEIDPEGLKVLAGSFETIVEKFKIKSDTDEHGKIGSK
jgi:hypothetical protein